MELDSVRAMFSEKEKELSVAVAKVEQLTAQLESLKVATPSPPASSSTPPASATAGITGYNSNGAKGATGPQGDGNNLVFDRMNSQILVSKKKQFSENLKEFLAVLLLFNFLVI